MRKSLVAIIAVAIIGSLGVYAKSTSSDAAKTTSQPAVQSDATMASNATSQTTDNSVSSSPAISSGQYKDGTYTGTSEANPYGDVQVQAVISGGKITNVAFLRMPSDEGHSREVTAFSEPVLKQETLQKQTAHIDFVSGATTTSESYQQSLQSALDQAA